MRPSKGNCMTEEVTEIPRCCSRRIQSEVAWRAALRPLTAPAIWIAPPNSSSFSVSVVLPASGCEMMANVLRRLISLDISSDVTDLFPRHVHDHVHVILSSTALPRFLRGPLTSPMSRVVSRARAKLDQLLSIVDQQATKLTQHVHSQQHGRLGQQFEMAKERYVTEGDPRPGNAQGAEFKDRDCDTGV